MAVVEGDQVAVAAGQALQFQHAVPPVLARMAGSGCTIAAGLVAAVPPEDEVGVLLGSYRVGRETEASRRGRPGHPSSSSSSRSGSSQSFRGTRRMDRLRWSSGPAMAGGVHACLVTGRIRP
jgi:hypothetical protein